MKEIKDLWLKTIKDLNKLDKDWIKKELTSAKKMYFWLQMKLQLNELKQTHLVKFLRKYIAVLNTITNSKI
jgi:ribosomal protein L29